MPPKTNPFAASQFALKAVFLSLPIVVVIQSVLPSSVWRWLSMIAWVIAVNLALYHPRCPRCRKRLAVGECGRARFYDLDRCPGCGLTEADFLKTEESSNNGDTNLP